jgi:hypothetical protein
MDKTIYEILEIHHKLLLENVNTWNPKHKELIQQSEKLIEELKGQSYHSYSNWNNND